MNAKKWLSALLVLGLLVLSGCGSNDTAVFVQSVTELSGLGAIAPGDRFPGVVVSEHVAEVQKDSDKTVSELLVREGDDVTEGQPLFSYDTEALQLSLDKQTLELEQLKATIDNYKAQITELEKLRQSASGTSQLEYTVQIQTLQVDLKEAELNLTAKETAVEKAAQLLDNASVTSPVSGRIQSVNESGTDSYGNPTAYITIQQAGSYRIKGTLGELQRGSILEGCHLRIVSRTDDSQFWTGTVSLVDYENPSQGTNYDSYYGSITDELTSSSKYPFYVELDSTDGLLLGQHVYLELDTGDSGESAAFALSSAFFCFDEDGSAYVWAEGHNHRLEKRTVTLGAYNEILDTYEITDGLTGEDYIAFPDETLCKSGMPVTREIPEEGAVGESEVG